MARIIRSEDERLTIVYHMRTQIEKKKLKSIECAEKLGVPHSQWSAWLNGKRTPLDDSLEKLAKFFGMDSSTDLLTPPQNWPEEKAKILKEQAAKQQKKALRNNSGLAEKPVQTNADAGDDDDDGTDHYLAIVGTLAKVQAKYNKGLMTKSDYNRHMRTISEFIDFSYRDVLQ